MSTGAAQFPYPGNDPGQLAALAAAYASAASSLNGLGQDTDSAATSLQNSWQGDAAAAARGKITDASRVIGDLRARLTKASTAVDGYRRTVVAVRHEIDSLRTQWETLQRSLASDQAEVRMDAMGQRTGDLSAAEASKDITATATDERGVANRLGELQDEYDAQLRRNNTAAHTCTSSLTALVPPTARNGSSTDGSKGADSGLFARLWEDAEPVREQLDKYRAGWDTLLGDAVLDKTVEYTQASKTFMDGLPAVEKQWWSEVSSLAHDADTDGDWASVEAAYARYAAKTDAAEVFGTQWLAEASNVRVLGNTLRAGGIAFGGVALYGDANTLLHPQDSGVMGDVDRAAAGVNMGLTGASMLSGGLAMADVSSFEIPVVGEVTMLGTGLYLGGDYMYHHVKWFHDAADDVGNFTVNTVKGAGHLISEGASGAWHGITGGISAIGSWL